MSLDKAIESGKEKRKQYKGAESVDKTCRHGGSCPWCKGKRLYNSRRRLLRAESEEEEYNEE